ncbi:hypothetical protein ACWGDT_05080 [Streptomyces avermitilis]
MFRTPTSAQATALFGAVIVLAFTVAILGIFATPAESEGIQQFVVPSACACCPCSPWWSSRRGWPPAPVRAARRPGRPGPNGRSPRCAGMWASVSRARRNGGTDIDLGVRYGIDEISRHSVSGRAVNCPYLFPYGDPTSGERDWIKVRANVAARLRGDPGHY